MKYENLDNLMNASFEELNNIPDIGDIIAKSIVDYFNDSSNKEIINEDFNGKTFVITGTLTKYTRDEVEEKIELLGGKASGSVSKKTYAVIVGENPGSKYDKAKELNIPIWSEEDLEEKFNE